MDALGEEYYLGVTLDRATSRITFMASTEGGFLGFGGTRLSDDEKKIIAELRTALGA